MKILINLPTWLGDGVMASPAIMAIYEHFKGSSFVLYGSYASCCLYKNMPNTSLLLEDKSKRYSNMLKNRKKYSFDLAISFRSALSSRLLLHILRVEKRVFFNKRANVNLHQCEQYLLFIKGVLNKTDIKDDLSLPINPGKRLNILAIAPGAKYGSAKRWKAQYFIQVARHFAKDKRVILLGSKDEKDLCEKIASTLKDEGLKVKNLCMKTSINSLAKWLGKASLLITNDSGPMHLAAVYKTPTVAIFGPTSYHKTSPFKNENAIIVHLKLFCMPCMQRVCPLKEHKCMDDLKPQVVIKAAEKLLNQNKEKIC